MKKSGRHVTQGSEQTDERVCKKTNNKRVSKLNDKQGS